jgi:hypothetical protein
VKSSVDGRDKGRFELSLRSRIESARKVEGLAVERIVL